MEVSTDDAHDVKALPNLVEEAEKRGRVSKVLGDTSGPLHGYKDMLVHPNTVVVATSGEAEEMLGNPTKGHIE